ncbi:MAG: MFS transporter [Actinomycetota bacterium]|nr:MFS transporter [Actinomycetota bacterium]
MASEAQSDERLPASIFTGRLRSATGAILILITLIAFEAMAVAAALPTAARDLHGLGGYGWAFTGFLLANVIGMVVSGQMCDAYGARRPLLAGLVCFAGGLVLAGSAVTMTQFVSGRVVQGLGSGLLITAIYVVIGETYAGELQPKLFAATSSAWVLPSLLGPVISGTLTQHLSWRWVFLGLLPFVLVGAALLRPVLRGLPRAPAGAGSGLADPRRILRALGVAMGIALVQSAGQHRTVLWLVAGVAGVALIGWGLHRLLPPGTARLRAGVATPVALRGLLAGAFFGVDASVPLAMTVQHGYSPTAAGLPLAASGVTWAFGSWWQGRPSPLPEPIRRVRLLRSGFALVAVSAVLVGVAQQPAAPGWLVYPAWSVAGVGMGLAMTSTSVLLLRYTTDADRGGDSAALQLSDATGAALTTGFGGVLVGAAAGATLGFTAAFWILTVTMAVIALGGLLAAGRARPPSAPRPAAPAPSTRQQASAELGR